MADRSRAKVYAPALVVIGLVAFVAYGLDQLAKYLVVTQLTEGVVVPVLGPVLQWQFVRNSGAAFSIGSGTTWIFTTLAVVVMGVVIWYIGRIRSLAWATVFGLLLGGLLGNLTDRLFREPGFGVGHVIDFITTPWLIPAIYNIADICIVSSMILFMILTIRGIGLDGKKVPSKAAAKSDADDAALDDRSA